MHKKRLPSIIVVFAVTLLVTAASIGCSKKESVPEPVELVLANATATPVEPTDPPALQIASERQAGERFTGTIVIEGFEETVHYEHIRNDTVGIEMDYDYEAFVRRSEPDRERFISAYDDLDHPEIYLDVTRSSESPDTVAASISEALSSNYDVGNDSVALDRAGTCIKLDASSDKTGHTPDFMQTVYIIPAADGCRIATIHYTFDSADGFGVRFRHIINSIIILDTLAS